MIVDNEDEFTYTLQRMFEPMGLATSVLQSMDQSLGTDPDALVLVGPGPGDPNNLVAPAIETSTGSRDVAGRKARICRGMPGPPYSECVIRLQSGRRRPALARRAGANRSVWEGFRLESILTQNGTEILQDPLWGLLC